MQTPLDLQTMRERKECVEADSLVENNCTLIQMGLS